MKGETTMTKKVITIETTQQKLLNRKKKLNLEIGRLEKELIDNFIFYPDEKVPGGGPKGESYDEVITQLLSRFTELEKVIRLRNYVNQNISVRIKTNQYFEGSNDSTVEMTLDQIIIRIGRVTRLAEIIKNVRETFPTLVRTRKRRTFLSEAEDLVLETKPKSEYILPQTKKSLEEVNAMYQNLREYREYLENDVLPYINSRIKVPEDYELEKVNLDQLQ